MARIPQNILLPINSREVHETCLSHRPCCAVIMDLTIPGGMGSKEAAQHILAFDSAASLIVASGYSNDPVMAEYKSYGFCAAVAKPCRPDEIARVLSAF